MIDLNEVWHPPHCHDLREIKEQLCATAPDWLPPLFPQARLSFDRRTLRCADLTGRPPRKEGSCIIALKGPRAGFGYDHATGESAGPIDLIYQATGLTNAALFDEAARLARMGQPVATRAPTAAKPDHALEVARILGGCQPVANTVAKAYLASRGLADPGCEDLKFHPDLTDFDTRRGWPGLVAVVRDGAGEPTGGIHRTFLVDDGSGKAPAGKKMLGPVAGGCVRLAAMSDDGHIGVAEGIETALAVQKIFGIPTWAALSADGLKRWRWPEGITKVTIFADAGDAGMQAAATLSDRLNMADIANEIVRPLHGDDFNDDLLKGAARDDYMASVVPAAVVQDEANAPQAEAVVAPASPMTVAEFEAAARTLTTPPNLAALGTLLGNLAIARLEPLNERQVLGLIKSATGIAVSILDKQIAELRRRLNATGSIHQRPVRPRWAHLLRLDLTGNPERNEANVLTALEQDEAFAGALVFDEFRQEVMANHRLPWDEPTATVPRAWQDGDDVRLSEWLQRHEIDVSPVLVSRCVATVARDIRVHPVREYLGGLKWDGIPRLEMWTGAYLGAADTPLNRAFGSLWMISAVARIIRPGCKADHMLILEGPQGARKSTALKVLAGEVWFTDELAEIGSKDAAQQMRGVWIIEIAELDAISRAEVSRIKAFLTRTTDRYRPPYGRYVVEAARQCVFAGSVNPDTYLRDETGNRRFWPIRCGEIDIHSLIRDRDQLWAEALHRYQKGAVWWLTDPALIEAARAEQEARYQSDAWDGLIDRWLAFERRRENRGYGVFDDWHEIEVERSQAICDVAVGDILQHAIGIEPGRWTRADQMRIAAYLRTFGWERYKAWNGGGREWRYRRKLTPD
ncbi:MAG: toprim domain-containing protein [Alphaproteobacteria bacterium]|nr:toprim domain-containing protein [Alphaproteobacteria bacterium]